jgi:predicted histidine transporter YuiF (NhaC family)
VAGCIPFYFIDLQEIPQGLLLGALVGIVPYILLGTIEKGETNKKSSKGAIILSISRFVLIAIALTLSATAYYHFDLKI